MNLNFNLEKKNTLKFLILVIFYLILFYFLIFKNLLIYFQIKEYIEVETLKSNKLKLENSELALSLKRKESEHKEKLDEIENFKTKKNNKLSFDKISTAFYKLDTFMKNRNIFPETLGRIQKKDKNLTNISLSFKADEENLLNFIKDLENSNFYFNLTESYFKISSFENENILISRVNIEFKLNENFEKTEIEIKNNNTKLFYTKNLKSENSSFIRMGNNIFYKKVLNGSSNNNEKKENLNSTGGSK